MYLPITQSWLPTITLFNDHKNSTFLNQKLKTNQKNFYPRSFHHQSRSLSSTPPPHSSTPSVLVSPLHKRKKNSHQQRTSPMWKIEIVSITIKSFTNFALLLEQRSLLPLQVLAIHVLPAQADVAAEHLPGAALLCRRERRSRFEALVWFGLVRLIS